MGLDKKPYTKAVETAVEKVKTFIDCNPTSRKSTDDFAEQFGVNRNDLQKGFKIIHKKRIKDYQFEKRMEAACEMLKQGTLIKKEISDKCGYENPNNFSSAFKKKYKMTPSKWQELFG
jgi:AraC-like DNA-binding protein